MYQRLFITQLDRIERVTYDAAGETELGVGDTDTDGCNNKCHGLHCDLYLVPLVCVTQTRYSG